MKLFLVGLPGSGKSTIGKDLSQKLNLPLLDTDDEICKREQASVEEIFTRHGEHYFREYERKILQELIHLERAIISTGGGLPCFYDNMEVINQYGISLFLNVAPSAIAERLWNHENQNRPLLKGKTQKDLLDFLEIKYKERYPYYSKSVLIFEGSKISAEEIVEVMKNKNLI